MILLVEDDSVGRKTFAELLRGRGYEVADAENGIEAVALLEKNRPLVDLVITDMVLPHLPEVPVIMISAYPSKRRNGQISQGRIFLAETSEPSALLTFVERVLPPSHG